MHTWLNLYLARSLYINLFCAFFMLKSSLYEQALLNRVGYTPEISHGVLVEMTEHRKELEKKTKPILDTLRSYQDLPPVITFII